MLKKPQILNCPVYPPWLSGQSKLALTDRNIHAKMFLKLVLKSLDYEFFGTKTHFYEMLTTRPLLDLMLVILSFKNKISDFVQINLISSFDCEPI